MTIEYTLFKSIVALSSDLGITHIPVGAVVEAPATFGGTGIVKVTYQGHVLRILALDLKMVEGFIWLTRIEAHPALSGLAFVFDAATADWNRLMKFTNLDDPCAAFWAPRSNDWMNASAAQAVYI